MSNSNSSSWLTWGLGQAAVDKNKDNEKKPLLNKRSTDELELQQSEATRKNQCSWLRAALYLGGTTLAAGALTYAFLSVSKEFCIDPESIFYAFRNHCVSLVDCSAGFDYETCKKWCETYAPLFNSTFGADATDACHHLPRGPVG